MILQVKQAQASVLEPFAVSRRTTTTACGSCGQRLTQAASDIFLGWTERDAVDRQYYVRQLWDAKGQATRCAWTCKRTLRRVRARAAQAHPDG